MEHITSYRDADLPRDQVTRAQFVNLFSAVFVPMFMAAVDQALLATATPAIADAIGGLRDASWISVGYLLASATIVPLYGRLGDRIGRREMLLAALGIFVLGSLACGMAQTLPQLVAARVLQGLGGGGLMTLSQALIGELVPPRERPRFQAYFGMVFAAASIGGPVIGGLVVSHASWRWLFFANLPLAAFAAWRLRRLPRSTGRGGDRDGRDPWGLALFAMGALSGLFWLTAVGHHIRWDSPASATLVTTAVLALGALVRHERRHPAPFLPVALLRLDAIKFMAITVVLFAACLFAIVFFLPIYLQLGHRVSAALSGVLLLPVTAGMLLASASLGRLIRRTGEPKPFPVAGMTVSAVALLALGVLPATTTLVIALGFIVGVGFGTVMPAGTLIVQTVAGPERLGAVTAMMSLARSTGAAIGTAVVGATAFSLFPGDIDVRTLLHAVNDAELQALHQAAHYAFLFAAAVAALAAASASRIPRVALWER